jgi:4-hydroxybenzoate polyprenyltransferase
MRRMIKKIKNLSYLLSPEESNIYLAIGVVALFIGIYFIYPPVALITIGIIFIVIAYLEAQKESMNGTS